MVGHPTFNQIISNSHGIFAYLRIQCQFRIPVVTQIGGLLFILCHQMHVFRLKKALAVELRTNPLGVQGAIRDPLAGFRGWGPTWGRDTPFLDRSPPLLLAVNLFHFIWIRHSSSSSSSSDTSILNFKAHKSAVNAESCWAKSHRVWVAIARCIGLALS